MKIEAPLPPQMVFCATTCPPFCASACNAYVIAAACEKSGTCKTLPVWKELYGVVNGYLDGKTLADLI